MLDFCPPLIYNVQVMREKYILRRLGFKSANKKEWQVSVSYYGKQKKCIKSS
jgi:hypothetical protein